MALPWSSSLVDLTKVGNEVNYTLLVLLILRKSTMTLNDLWDSSPMGSQRTGLIICFTTMSRFITNLITWQWTESILGWKLGYWTSPVFSYLFHAIELWTWVKVSSFMILFASIFSALPTPPIWIHLKLPKCSPILSTTLSFNCHFYKKFLVFVCKSNIGLF